MSELRPILRDDPTDDEKRLLGSARLDVPPRAARRRTLAAMSLAAAVTTTAGTGGAAAATVSVGVIVKWTALGALGGTLALGAVGSLTPLALGHRSPAIAVRPAPAVSHADGLRPGPSFPSRVAPEGAQSAHSDVQAQPVPPDVQEQRDLTPPVRVVPSSSARGWERRAEPRPSTDLPASPALPPGDRATVPAADDTLAAEVAALDEARRALAAGGPAHALLTLDAYDHRFALRRLGPEAAVLRIEALMAEGRFAQARQLGEQLLATEPDGAYAQHVRSLLSIATP